MKKIIYLGLAISFIAVLIGLYLAIKEETNYSSSNSAYYNSF